MTGGEGDSKDFFQIRADPVRGKQRGSGGLGTVRHGLEEKCFRKIMGHGGNRERTADFFCMGNGKSERNEQGKGHGSAYSFSVSDEGIKVGWNIQNVPSCNFLQNYIFHFSGIFALYRMNGKICTVGCFFLKNTA